MNRFTVSVYGQRAVANNLRGAAASMPRQTTNTAYDWAQQHVMRQLSVKPYPAPRPKQRYRRTGDLGRGWRAGVRGKAVYIENEMPYAGYVVGDGKGQRQAWMHRGRWFVMRSMVEQQRPQLNRMMNAMIERQFAMRGPSLERATGGA